MTEPVPDLLRGAWRRTSIVNDDGTSDTTSLVVWLQLESQMVDVRLPAGVNELAVRDSFARCSTSELRALAECEASTGFTTCTAPEIGDDGVRRATAEWHTRGEDDIAYHPLTAYPEPGLLEWTDDGTVMIERAPSGAYVEEWHLVPGSSDALDHRVLPDGRRVYRTGPIAVVVRARPSPLPRVERVDILVTEAGDDRAALESLVDVEFSIVQHGDDGWRITASTLPWRSGEVIDVDL